ncbi:MAG: hypothetical protein APR53_05165 [Methanoculleus sp. SDB]|nr:MAG: hypothetical protein APR53_05165 [Methanoculleus sp. SDB]
MTHDTDDPYRILSDLISRLLEQSPAGYRFTMTVHGGDDPGEGRRGDGSPPDIIEPHREVQCDGDDVRITADIPGADAGDIRFAVRGQRLVIAAPAGDRLYRSVVDLPPVRGGSVTHTFRHGVLEIVLKKADL